MSATGRRRNAHVLRAVAGVLTLSAMLLLPGCGQPDPVSALRETGVTFERNDRQRITHVDFPDEAGDEALEPLKRLKHLEEVDLSETQITGEGLQHLAKLPNLRVIDLRKTRVGDDGLEHLKNLKSLEVLRVGDTQVTADGLRQLKGLENLELVSLARPPKPKEPEPRAWTDAIRLGIDLAGGTNLVFQVETDDPQKPVTPEVMDRMVGAVARRVNPSGTEEVTVRQVGSTRIEVIIPGADPEVVEQKKEVITRLGSLEFAILANRRDHGEEGIKRPGLIQQARKLPDDEKNLRDETGRIIASWREVGRDGKGNPKEISEHGEVVTRELEKDGEVVKEFLVVFEPQRYRVTGEYLTRAYEASDPNTGAPAVGFTFNSEGANRFYRLTSQNPPLKDGFRRRLAILLDGKVHSAPNLNEPISNRGQITGQFTREEVDELINVLNAGALEVPLNPDPVSEYTISPLLGADVQQKGKTAILVAAITVFVFMAAYYLFAGMVADFCLVVNLILVMGVMAFIQAAFTLPGLAGLVLTIGMAVDANVLIFERIREEKLRGSSLRMAIQNGFARATTAIVDAQVTTLITALVLYMIGTDQVRGFAVTLIIGILTSMYAALYAGRLIFDICERKRWISDLRMFSLLGLFRGQPFGTETTRIDFIGKKAFAAVVSVALIAVGMGTLFARGERNLDIDFTGGTMVTFEFLEPHDIGEVREHLGKTFDTFSLEQLQLGVGQQQTEGAGDFTQGRRFRLRTPMRDVEIAAGGGKTIGQLIHNAFETTGLHLRQVTMDRSSIASIPAAASAEQDGQADDESPQGEDADGEATDGQEETGDGDNPFAGGYQLTLTFTDRAPPAPGREDKPVVSPTTAVDYLIDQLEKLENEFGDPKYNEPRSLFDARVAETTRISTEEAAGQGRRTEIALKAKSDLDRADLEMALAGVQEKLANEPVFEEINTFASSVASEMRWSATMAILASLVFIVLYLWFRFKQATFGLAAVAALVHDVAIVLGMVAVASWAAASGFTVLGLQEFKINLPMIAAFLTVVGYSLNDTIVVFDRIREVRGKNPALSTEMVNLSLNQTLARTLLTSLTTFLVVAILYTFGGEGIHGFAFCLVIGVIVGTYSSMYVASPVLLWLMNRPGSPSRSAVERTEAARAGT